ncbi:hypothetical protein [Asanoa sp. NPDC050611]|uniref:glycine-rich domain-containing protein n=1 Tax=Asanoa sp. NPDC050611 TaxID=3157098 RepID=UPI0033DA22C7
MNRFLARGKSRRTAAVDSFVFPSNVRLRFAGQHQHLSPDQVRTVEAAARQWFRLAARHPRAKLSMPSVVVDDLWHEMVLDTREYAAFCEAAFGRFLHHVPEQRAESADRSRHLLATFQLACEDEGCEPDRLPLLFSIDRQLAVDGGRYYLADCGGRGQCHGLRGTTCLRHLTGEGRSSRFGAPGHHRTDLPPSVGGDGCGGGCGN